MLRGKKASFSFINCCCVVFCWWLVLHHGESWYLWHFFYSSSDGFCHQRNSRIKWHQEEMTFNSSLQWWIFSRRDCWCKWWKTIPLLGLSGFCQTILEMRSSIRTNELSLWLDFWIGNCVERQQLCERSNTVLWSDSHCFVIRMDGCVLHILNAYRKERESGSSSNIISSLQLVCSIFRAGDVSWTAQPTSQFYFFISFHFVLFYFIFAVVVVVVSLILAAATWLVVSATPDITSVNNCCCVC